MKTIEKEKRIAHQKELQTAAERLISGEFDVKNYYGLTDEGLEAIYTVGYEMYKHKQYDKAKDVFSLLCLLDGKSSKFLSACGGTYFMAGDYANALVFFRMLLLNGDYTPKTIMKMAECALKLQQPELALEYLREVINLCGTDEHKASEEAQSFSSRASMMVEAIEDHIKAVAEQPQQDTQKEGRKKD